MFSHYYYGIISIALKSNFTKERMNIGHISYNYTCLEIMHVYICFIFIYIYLYIFIYIYIYLYIFIYIHEIIYIYIYS